MKLSILLAVGLMATAVHAAPVFPEFQGKLLLDAADVIPDDQEAEVNDRLLATQRSSGHQMMVLTVPSLNGEDIDSYGVAAGRHYGIGIDSYGVAAGRHYGIGNKDSDDGVLMTIAPTEHKMRIDVGPGLQVMLTDAQTSEIISDMKPYFKANDFTGGITTGIEEVSQIIVPMSPEQIEIKRREASNARIRHNTEMQKLNGLLFEIFGTGLLGALCAGAYWLITAPKRARDKARREREAREAQLRYEEEARLQRERDRLAEIEAAARRKAAWDAAEVRRQQAEEARAAMLAAMSISDRTAFLAREQAERERQRRAEEEAERVRAERRRREQEEADARSAAAAALAASSSSSWSSSSSDSSWSSSSSNDSSSGGGGSFDGGGASGSW